VETVRDELKLFAPADSEQDKRATVPYSPFAKKALALAAKEAKTLGHTYVGTEHLLLGLLDSPDRVAARIFQKVNADLEQVRQRILTEIGF